MSKSEILKMQEEKNKRLGLILASIAGVFFVGLIIKKMLLG